MDTQTISGQARVIAVVQDLPGYMGQKVAQLGVLIAEEKAASTAP